MSGLEELLRRVEAPGNSPDEIALVLSKLVDATDLSTGEAGTIRLYIAAGAFLDAAIALVEKRSGAYLWMIHRTSEYEATVWLPAMNYSDGDQLPSGSSRSNPALALLAALLRAEISNRSAST